ncbi:MAG: enoyl-CoA hydratase-related protein [Candidatus Magnetoovum sp. WYHC-5]|nr:enoyl-CoA hydratase-related protein [Candidatus Magnetoovum sp. WYHC-5]
MNYKNLLLEKKEEDILIIYINRPSNLNSLNKDTLNELHVVFKEASEQQQISVIVITGFGKHFSVGADVTEFKDITWQEAREISELGHRVFKSIEECPKPVIGAINGYALGGGLELAISCHLLVASKEAKLGLPEVNLALIPGFGGTQRLTRLIGRFRAFEMIMSGGIIGADYAKSIGILNDTVEANLLIDRCLSIATDIKKKSAIAISSIINCVNSFYNDGVNGYDVEINSFSELFRHKDHKEGIYAFLEKRPPKFRERQ